MLYNILQTWNTTGASQTMLGCNVDIDTAEKYLKKYTEGTLKTNSNRAKSGNPPLDVTYRVVEVEGLFQNWLPESCK